PSLYTDTTLFRSDPLLRPPAVSDGEGPPHRSGGRKRPGGARRRTDALRRGLPAVASSCRRTELRSSATCVPSRRITWSKSGAWTTAPMATTQPTANTAEARFSRLGVACWCRRGDPIRLDCLTDPGCQPSSCRDRRSDVFGPAHERGLPPRPGRSFRIRLGSRSSVRFGSGLGELSLGRHP